jgi:hypothetical protein
METKTRELDEETKMHINITMSLISEFAYAYKMSVPRAYKYLEDYGGIEYLDKHYKALQAKSTWDAVLELLEFCQANGAPLR